MTKDDFQLGLEFLAELGMRGVREPFRRTKPLNPWLAGLGYSIFGAVAGAISLGAFPASFIRAPWLRILNLVLTPILAGVAMTALGRWRKRKDQELIRLDRFAYAFLFALAIALVRFKWAK